MLTRKMICLSLVALFCLVGNAGALTFHVTDDSYVTGKSDLSRNYGDSIDIKVNKNDNYGFGRFDISILNEHFTKENIVKATLVLYVKKLGHSGNIYFYLVNEEWQEDEITFHDQPKIVGDSRLKKAVDQDDSKYDKYSFIYVDVTTHLEEAMEEGFNHYSFRAYPADNAIDIEFASKENGGNAMQLEILLGGITKE